MIEIHSETGGRPRKVDDLLILQSEVYKALVSQYTRIAQDKGNFIISGCEMSITGSSIAAGIVYIGGDIVEFAGATNVTFPVSMMVNEELTTNLQYLDGGTKPTRKRTYAALYNSAVNPTPTATNSLSFSAAGVQELRDIIVYSHGDYSVYGTKNFRDSLQINGVDVATSLTTLNGNINTTNANLTTTDNNLATTNTNVTTLQNTKVSQRIARVGWTDLILNPGYSTIVAVGGGLNNGYYKAAMMRTEDGFVHLRGLVEFVVGSGIGGSSQGFLCSLPAGFLPSRSTRHFVFGLSGDFRVAIEISQYGIYVIPFVNQTYVSQFVPPNGTNLAYTLDNITYYADGTGGVQ